MHGAAATVVALGLSDRCGAVDFRHVAIASTQVTVAEVDPATEAIRLFLRDDAGHPFRTLQALDAWVKRQGRTLAFAMNAGMYRADLSPLGLLVLDGDTRSPLDLADGAGNFYLKPNGVFFIEGRRAGILETDAYRRSAHRPQWATQSGPMLVRDGAIHPAFRADSRSRLVRNGVGVTPSGHVVFAISDGPVSLHEFATLFRDRLGCSNALYLDGVVSGLHAPALGRSDATVPLGPMVGVVE
jgi:uncharacterized protein YigE (DUF2233 family)